jgi:two-component system nitrogen regulation response regulator GlnG
VQKDAVCAERMMSHVLLIDDDPLLIAEQLGHIFPRPAHKLSVARSGGEGLAAVRASVPDVVLLDLRLPDQSGLSVYEAIRKHDARLPVVFITSDKTADPAIEAMKRGAFNYIGKPLDLKKLEAIVLEAIDLSRRMRAPVRLQPSQPDIGDDVALFGNCSAMLDVYKKIGLVAAQDVIVLITGESGTGKELVARAIYQHGKRAKAPFLALNCAAIPEGLLESELFGHEKGAFTGAERRRIGKFEQYSGGTVLLDEIGDMPLPLQAKLLRVMQDQSFERVGGNETIRTDVRLIAATHRDLKSRVAEEKFRLDLYYRIGVFTIHLPPLRERDEDLPLLAQHFVRRFSRELGRDIREIAPETMARLRAYAWPGNVRELEGTLKQAMLHAQGYTLTPSSLPPLAEPLASVAGAGDVVSTPSQQGRCEPAARERFDVEAFVRQRLRTGPGELYGDTRDYVDRMLFKVVLDFTQGNLSAAAEMLGISRQTMRGKLRALGISVGHSVELDDET